MKTAITISKENHADGHVCQCDSHKVSHISEKNESSVGCGCGEGHSHEGHHHASGHVCECDHNHDKQNIQII